MWTDPYRIISLVFIIILLLVFIYSFAYESINYHVPSATDMLNADNSVSKGLSRSFSAIMHFRFEQARALNPNSIRVFVFFFIQFFLRTGTFLLSVYVKGDRRKMLITADVILSVLLFVFCFRRFIEAMIR